MKKSVLVYVFVLVASIMLYSCGKSDEKIKQSVETALTTTNSGSVSTDVKNGVVTLKGTVNTPEEKMAVENAVKALKDVKSVNNEIQINMPAPAPVSADQTLTNTINTGLTAAGLSGINVAINNGEVTLTGEVKRADLPKVMQIANDAKPTKVNNQLTIK
ncbi:MAG: BON domain-containing protein [Dysgonomonas sp.]|nr:BON domain-containing protein [Dysgonomonas sp.]